MREWALKNKKQAAFLPLTRLTGFTQNRRFFCISTADLDPSALFISLTSTLQCLFLLTCFYSANGLRQELFNLIFYLICKCLFSRTMIGVYNNGCITILAVCHYHLRHLKTYNTEQGPISAVPVWQWLLF